MSEEQVTLEQELQQVFAEILETIKILQGAGDEDAVQDIRNKVWFIVGSSRNYLSSDELDEVFRKAYK